MGSGDRVRTYSAPPEGMPDPVATATGPTTVLVTWRPPRFSNGVIISYRVYRRHPQVGSFEELIFYSTDSSAHSYTDSDSVLRPFTEYEYQVRVSNMEGEVSSIWVGVTTFQDSPTGVETPVLEAKSAFAVQANWKEPTFLNGILTSYR